MINKKHISLLTLAIFLSLSHFAVSASAQPSVVEVPSVSVQPSVDSLSHYLEQAARSNPQVNADFMLYKASLEKIPQAGAFADPELEIGFFVKPMETLMGKQIADFTLMQMFPWFGTRKAARSEASEMARMAYEQFHVIISGMRLRPSGISLVASTSNITLRKLISVFFINSSSWH